MTEKSTLIVLLGGAHSGKGLVARYLEKNHQFTILRHTDYLERIISDLHPNTPRKEDFQAVWEKELYRGDKQALGNFIRDRWGDALTRFLCRRLLDPSYLWSSGRYVVEDARFFSEVDTFTETLAPKGWRVVCWGVRRPDADKAPMGGDPDDRTERDAKAMTARDVDYLLANDKAPIDLYEQAERALFATVTRPALQEREMAAVGENK